MTTRLSDALDTMTVEDVMMTPVIVIDADAPVTDLIRLLDYEQVSGVPVLDERGQLAGVVSTTDVLRLVARNDEIDAVVPSGFAAAYDDDDETGHDYFMDPADRLGLRLSAEDYVDALGGYRVADIMTAATFTVRPQATIRELARFLNRGGIHRALVVERGELRGIVTTSDVVRAVAEATDPEP